MKLLNRVSKNPFTFNIHSATHKPTLVHDSNNHIEEILNKLKIITI